MKEGDKQSRDSPITTLRGGGLAAGSSSHDGNLPSTLGYLNQNPLHTSYLSASCLETGFEECYISMLFAVAGSVHPAGSSRPQAQSFEGRMTQAICRDCYSILISADTYSLLVTKLAASKAIVGGRANLHYY